MQEHSFSFVWPEINHTVSIVALALAAAIIVLGMFSGARANKFRFLSSICAATLIGWLAMPLAVKAAAALHLADKVPGVVILVTVMMGLVAAVATSLYEIVTVTFPDIGLRAKK